MNYEDLPALNASLNAASALAVGVGYVCIKLRRVKAHKVMMGLGVFLSACFLASYLTFHLNAEAKKFTGTGWTRYAYFTMLISHIILAAAIVPMVLASVWFGFRNRLEKHVKLAKWTLPLWLYVSVTGVTIYFVLY